MATLEQQLLHLAQQLADVMKEEVDVLQGPDRHQIAEIVEKKTTVANQYTRCFEAWQQKGIPFQNVSKAQGVLQALKEAVEENERVIQAILTASETFLGFIVEAAEKITKPIKTYNAKGRVAAGKKNAARLSMTLDHKL